MGNMRILVIEDEHKIAQFVKTGLELESWAVDLTFDGESGMDFAVTEKYDVIILDLMVPKISGLEFIKLLRNKEQIHTPILVLTARGATDDKIECLNYGADDYLVKPFVFAELVARVRALSRRPQQQTDNRFKLGNLILDIIKHEVKRSGKKIELSKREYALLEFLMKHKGEAKSKQEITQNVWSYDDDILPNTVEVYINYLREKIEKPFPGSKSLIHTIRGYGYKLDTNE
jgi:DNA-binding response OmpR family regulator